jgi:hypothetical protein
MEGNKQLANKEAKTRTRRTRRTNKAKQEIPTSNSKQGKGRHVGRMHWGIRRREGRKTHTQLARTNKQTSKHKDEKDE